MNLEKTAKIAGDWRTIWIAVLAMLSVAAWAGDTRWAQKAEVQRIPLQIKVDRLTDDIEELVFEKRFETDQSKIKKLNAYIEYKEKQLAAELQKYSIR